VIASRQPFTVDLLYSDHEGGQRTISRFSFVPRERNDGWLCSAARHWNLDRPDPGRTTTLRDLEPGRGRSAIAANVPICWAKGGQFTVELVGPTPDHLVMTNPLDFRTLPAPVSPSPVRSEIDLTGTIPSVHRQVEQPDEGLAPTFTVTRHNFQLSDGHQVSALVAGSGVPLVLVHGFGADAGLYTQPVTRLAGMGFKVVAVDTAGHGNTASLGRKALDMSAYTDLLVRVLDELGIRKCILAGHSMGGGLVAELAASQPERVMGLFLLDAAVGEPWDRLVEAMRLCPPLLGALGVASMVDGIATLPFTQDARQTVQLTKLLARTLLGGLRHPWQLAAPALSVLASGPRASDLDHVRTAGVPTFVVHGDRDRVVPLSTARDAAQRTNGELVVVKGGGHCWLLNDPESFPAIVAELLEGRLGDAYQDTLEDAGLDADWATEADIADVFYQPDALARTLGAEPSFGRFNRLVPRLRWDTTPGHAHSTTIRAERRGRKPALAEAATAHRRQTAPTPSAPRVTTTGPARRRTRARQK
jgi:pimeloyl-ACP methyl ester carboxylesterase